MKSSLQTTILNLMKMAESSRNGFSKRVENNVGKGEIVFSRLLLQTHKNQGLFEKGLRKEGSWSDPWFGQNSIQGLMLVIAPGFIALSPLSILLITVMWKCSSILERILCRVMVKELQESMDMCTGSHDITEIVLKMALKTLQSIKNKQR